MARYKVGLETRERILKATRALLADVGVEGITLKAITDLAGVRAGSFYNLFETKEAAVLTVVREAIAAMDPGDEGNDTLEDLVSAYVTFMTEQSSMAQVYLQIAVSATRNNAPIRQRFANGHRYRIERFTTALLRDRPDIGVPEATIRIEALIAALNGFGIARHIDPSFDLNGHASRMLELTRTQ
ncbi:MAG: TetR/AcrR family transcriptional regulator [Acidimicrobiia bacterium]|nr:TetR/AcrR family transcriptional regulator [Acidimicrobiia bacterium]